MYYAGSNKGKIFRGSAKPLNHYRGYTKCEGWHYSDLNGENLTVLNTYDDDCSLTINGKSEQTQTTQSKNLFDANKYKFELVGSNATLTSDANNVYTFTGNANTYGIRTISGVPVKPNTNYVFSCKVDILSGALATGGYGCRIQFMSDNTYTNTYKTWNIAFNSGNSTSVRLLVYVGIPNPNAITVNFSQFQLEEGTVATVYTPFVPNSPSPDYPSEIDSVNNFNLVSSNMSDKTQTINFPYTLGSTPSGVCDQIIVDNVNKTARYIKNINELIFYGSEDWTLLGTAYGLTGIRLTRYDPGTGAALSTPSYCSHLPWVPSGFTAIGHFMDYYDVNVWLPQPGFPDVATFKTLLATHPMTITYQLDTPIITDLSYEAVLTYYPQTQIYTNAIIQPTLDGTFKVMDT